MTYRFPPSLAFLLYYETNQRLILLFQVDTGRPRHTVFGELTGYGRKDPHQALLALTTRLFPPLSVLPMRSPPTRRQTIVTEIISAPNV